MNETSIKDTREILKEISRLKASDIFVVAGRPLSYRLNNQIREYSQERLMPEDTLRIIQDIYAMASSRNISPLTDQGDDDFSFALPGISRFRVNTYMQRGSAAAVIRIISYKGSILQKLVYRNATHIIQDTFGHRHAMYF